MESKRFAYKYLISFLTFKNMALEILGHIACCVPERKVGNCSKQLTPVLGRVLCTTSNLNSAQNKSCNKVHAINQTTNMNHSPHHITEMR